jgi:hypothetical protein
MLSNWSSHQRTTEEASHWWLTQPAALPPYCLSSKAIHGIQVVQAPDVQGFLSWQDCRCRMTGDYGSNALCNRWCSQLSWAPVWWCYRLSWAPVRSKWHSKHTASFALLPSTWIDGHKLFTVCLLGTCRMCTRILNNSHYPPSEGTNWLP